MHDLDPLIDAALDSVPLSPTPPGFRRRVMSQIAQAQVKRVKSKPPEFRLDFLDLALPAFFAFIASLGFTVLLWLASLLNPQGLEHFQLSLKSAIWSLPVLEIGGILVAAEVCVIMLLFALIAAAFVINSNKFQGVLRYK